MTALILITVLLLIFVVLAVLFIANLGRAKAGGAGFTVARPPQGDGFVNETLVDEGGYLYHVERGHKRTFVNQGRPGVWRSIADEIIVVGTQYHKAVAQRFLRERAPWLDLERDPTNKYDRNAIKVMATWTEPNGKTFRELIGYVDKEVAAVIAAEVPPEMPMTATIDSMAVSEKYVASIYFSIQAAGQWCPHCHGDLGKMPAKSGECPECGGRFKLSPTLWVPVPA